MMELAAAVRMVTARTAAAVNVKSNATALLLRSHRGCGGIVVAQQQQLPILARRTLCCSHFHGEGNSRLSGSGTTTTRAKPHFVAARRSPRNAAAEAGAAMIGGGDDDDGAPPYVSPMKDLFDQMHANGPTTLGTTDEWVDFDLRMAAKTLHCGIPERALRFTCRSWGRTLAPPQVHPNEHRVVLRVHRKHLPLDAVGMEILKEVVGNRLTDDQLNLQANQFGSRIENKRHLESMLDRIVLSCQRLAADLKADGDGDDDDDDDDDDDGGIMDNEGEEVENGKDAIRRKQSTI
jgi:Mitochondrial ribosomal subunit protein